MTYSYVKTPKLKRSIEEKKKKRRDIINFFNIFYYFVFNIFIFLKETKKNTKKFIFF